MSTVRWRRLFWRKAASFYPTPGAPASDYRLVRSFKNVPATIRVMVKTDRTGDNQHANLVLRHLRERNCPGANAPYEAVWQLQEASRLRDSPFLPSLHEILFGKVDREIVLTDLSFELQSTFFELMKLARDQL